MSTKPILLIALGGNALIQKGQSGSAEQQFENLKLPMQVIARLSKEYSIVITHGNGPQVGNLLLQQESCSEVPKMPLEVIGAQSQGQIGYMIESTLDSALMEEGISDRFFCTLLTYTVVDKNDPLFQNPTKPIGPFYTEEEAAKLPYRMVQTDKGPRRVVASPKPVTIVEHREIKKLLDMDFIVICCGGGGIPVIREGRKFSGVDAVIDKDLASSKLAEQINADKFIIASDIEGAAIYWGKPQQQILKKVSLADMNRYTAEGHFPPGSMGPKVEAVTNFVKGTGKKGVICKLSDIELAVAGKAGTEVSK
ncbi:MAG: carbamate kinase [Desulfobacterales bacterium]|nr:carbamate kinase [Desulfobacterales bacterium]MDD4073553.1 carbamate kinase [Desulfobacterales bacterium]MDD4393629.1 carbamate kinase [Desulfobacterales bacterium]